MKKAFALLLVLLLAFSTTVVFADEGEQIEVTENSGESSDKASSGADSAPKPVVTVPPTAAPEPKPEVEAEPQPEPEIPVEPETPTEPAGGENPETPGETPQENENSEQESGDAAEPDEVRIENSVTGVPSETEETGGDYAIAPMSLLGPDHVCVYSKDPVGDPVEDPDPTYDCYENEGIFANYHFIVRIDSYKYPCTVEGCTDFIVKGVAKYIPEKHSFSDDVCEYCCVEKSRVIDDDSSDLPPEMTYGNICQHIQEKMDSGEFEKLLKWTPLVPDGGDWDAFAGEAKKGNYRYTKYEAYYKCPVEGCNGWYQEDRDYFVAEPVKTATGTKTDADDDDDYVDDDDMPKTGQTGPSNAMLVLMAGSCFAAYLAVRRRRVSGK